MTLLKLIDHDVKQCRLNSCAALYAISCAGRPICREIAEKQPMHKLVALVCPGVGRTSQDDQLQLFAALLVVNLLHVRGAVKTKPERETLSETLQRVRRLDRPAGAPTILLGVKKLKKAETRKAKLKAGVRGAGSTLVRKMTGGVVGGPKSKPGAPGSAYGGSAESFGSGGTQGGYDGGGYGGGGGGGFGDQMRNSGGGGSGGSRFRARSGGPSSENRRRRRPQDVGEDAVDVEDVGAEAELPSMGSKRGSKKFSESTDWE